MENLCQFSSPIWQDSKHLLSKNINILQQIGVLKQNRSNFLIPLVTGKKTPKIATRQQKVMRTMRSDFCSL